jgi:hypothetical protein
MKCNNCQREIFALYGVYCGSCQRKLANQALDNLAAKSIQITAEALHQKDQIIKVLEQKLALCACQKEVPHE